MSDQLRERFQVWANAKGAHVEASWNGEFYENRLVESAWQGYKARDGEACQASACERDKTLECRCWCGRECGCICHDSGKLASAREPQPAPRECPACGLKHDVHFDHAFL